MKQYFECTIKRDSVIENGTQKKVQETYLVDAMSFTESEARIIEDMQNYISGDFEVKSIKRARYDDIFRSEYSIADKFFKSKLFYIAIDEKTGSEKKSINTVLVQAADLRDAVKCIDQTLLGTTIDYIVASVSLTPILEIIDYNPAENDDSETNG